MRGGRRGRGGGRRAGAGVASPRAAGGEACRRSGRVPMTGRRPPPRGNGRPPAPVEDGPPAGDGGGEVASPRVLETVREWPIKVETVQDSDDDGDGVWVEAEPLSPPLGLPRRRPCRCSAWQRRRPSAWQRDGARRADAFCPAGDERERGGSGEGGGGGHFRGRRRGDAASEKDGKEEEDAAPAEEDNGETE